MDQPDRNDDQLLTDDEPRRPSIAPEDVEAICATIWPNEAAARGQAAQVEVAGYDVTYFMAAVRPANRLDVRSVAWVKHPPHVEHFGGRTIGDVQFRVSTEPGS
jgi:hypothetical protein